MKETPNEQALRFQWLVSARQKNQELMSKLYRCNLPIPYTTERRIYNYLIGITFSLWRAAPLTFEVRNIEDMYNHGKKVLEKLVADNAINYAQEKETNFWMSGFYLNNSKFRLEEIKILMIEHGISADRIDFNRLDSLSDEVKIIENLQIKWDLSHEITVQVFDSVMSPFEEKPLKAKKLI
jgi:hypothetical protein